MLIIIYIGNRRVLETDDELASKQIIVAVTKINTKRK